VAHDAERLAAAATAHAGYAVVASADQPSEINAVGSTMTRLTFDDRSTAADKIFSLHARAPVIEVQPSRGSNRDAAMRAMRTNLRYALADAEMVGNEEGLVVQLSYKGDESGVMALMQTSLELALSSRVWLVRCVRLVVLCCAFGMVPLVFSAADARAGHFAHDIQRYEREILTFILACNIILVAQVQLVTRVVARLEAAGAAAAAVFVVGFVWLHVVRAGGLTRAMAQSPGDWALFAAAAGSTRALAANSPVALGFGAALSYCSMLLASWAVVVLGLALAALTWHACVHYHSIQAPGRRDAACDGGKCADDWSVPRALSPVVFKRIMFGWYGGAAALFAVFDVWHTGVIIIFASARSRADELALHACSFAVNVCLLAFCSSRACQRLVYDAARACGRSTTRQGALLSLAPLLGVSGENQPPDAAEIAANAKRDFRVVRLDARARGSLLQRTASATRLELQHASTEATAGYGGYERPRLLWSSARVVPLQSQPLEAAGGEPGAEQQQRQRSGQHEQAEHEPRAGPYRGGMRRLNSVLTALQRMPSFLSETSRSGCTSQEVSVAVEHAERADAYVVHAAADHHVSAELCSWAERFEAEEGRAPTVWLRQLCASRSLAPAELLAHLPCYLARSDRLLLLVSPETPLDLTVATTCYVWRVLGGRPSTVDAVLLASASPTLTVDAFDTFHVMHTGVTDGDKLERAAATERLRSCVRLANV
jgi:hypothetical protein